LLEAITHQQLSTKAAATIFGRVKALVKKLEPEHFLSLENDALRGAGLSRAKVLAVQDLAERSCSGDVPPILKLNEMDDAEIIDSLIQIRGIGRWSAEMLLIFRLERLDVLPTTDLTIQQGFAATFRKSKKPIVKARSVASWYLWRAAELARRKKA